MYIIVLSVILYAYVCCYNLLSMLLLQDGDTPFQIAHDRGHSQIIQLLLSKGAKVECWTSIYTYIAMP